MNSSIFLLAEQVARQVQSDDDLQQVMQQALIKSARVSFDEAGILTGISGEFDREGAREETRWLLAIDLFQQARASVVGTHGVEEGEYRPVQTALEIRRIRRLFTEGWEYDKEQDVFHKQTIDWPDAERIGAMIRRIAPLYEAPSAGELEIARQPQEDIVIDTGAPYYDLPGIDEEEIAGLLAQSRRESAHGIEMAQARQEQEENRRLGLAVEENRVRIPGAVFRPMLEAEQQPEKER